MQKTINNFTVVQLSNILLSPEGFWLNPEKRSKLKVYVPVRSAIKKNVTVLEEYAKEYSEMYQEIMTELQEDFIASGKAKWSDEETDTSEHNRKFIINKDYQRAYEVALAEKLDPLLKQEYEVEFRGYTDDELDRFAELNGEWLSELEMTALEFFMEDKA